jgi:RecG-like helicase
MSAEARADRPKFRYRLFGADLQVKGEVVAIEQASNDSARLVLKTSEKPRIVVDTQSRSAETSAALKREFPIGTKVFLLGEVKDETAQPLTDVFLFGQVMKDE